MDASKLISEKFLIKEPYLLKKIDPTCFLQLNHLLNTEQIENYSIDSFVECLSQDYSRKLVKGDVLSVKDGELVLTYQDQDKANITVFFKENSLLTIHEDYSDSLLPKMEHKQ